MTTDLSVALTELGERTCVGPEQAKLAQISTIARSCGGQSGGTISRPRVTDGHILDTVAHVYGLLPEFHALWLEPLQVVILASELPPCDACAGFDARFEIPGAPRGWAMALCRRCALKATGNRRLGPASAQQLVMLDEVPRNVRTRCEAVATEIGQPSPWVDTE